MMRQSYIILRVDTVRQSMEIFLMQTFSLRTTLMNKVIGGKTNYETDTLYSSSHNMLIIQT